MKILLYCKERPTLTSILMSIRGVEPLSERYRSEQEDVNYGLQGLLLGKDRVRFRLAEVW
jgi:hypothetical protein